MVALTDRINKTFETKFTASAGERAVVARISTTSVDRDGDVMMPSGLNMQDFRKNPVVILAHDTGSLPIGTVESIDKESSGVVAKIIFAKRPDTHPASAEWIPDTVFSLFQQKVLRAFSVGFLIDDARPAEQKDYGRFGEGVERVITKWRLVEVSVVPVPANQDALAHAVSKSWLGRHAWKPTGLKLAKPQGLVLQFPRPLNLSAV